MPWIFLNPVLSTNQRPRFWALNQWEASISGPLILTHFQYHTALLAIRLQSQQSDCNLSNPYAISTIWLQSLQSDSILHNQTAVSTIRQQFLQSDCNLHNRTAIYTIRLQCRRIAVWLLRLQSDCWDCSLIAEIAVLFVKWVEIGGPEIEASHWLRVQNWGLWLVERTG